jgi:hypothetical protein
MVTQRKRCRRINNTNQLTIETDLASNKLYIYTCTAAAVSSARLWLMVGLLLKKATIWSMESFRYCQSRKNNHTRANQICAHQRSINVNLQLYSKEKP